MATARQTKSDYIFKFISKNVLKAAEKAGCCKTWFYHSKLLPPEGGDKQLSFCWPSFRFLGVLETERSKGSLPRDKQELFGPRIGETRPLGWLRLLWGSFFCLSSFDLDFWFGLFNEPQELSIVFQLAALVNQLWTVGELDPLARVPKPAYPRNSLQGFPCTWKLLSNN